MPRCAQKRLTAGRRQGESLGAADKTPCQIAHHDVLMAIADKQNSVMDEHLHQEPCRPTVGQVRLTEVAITEDERFASGNRAMQIHQAREVPAQRERRGVEDVGPWVTPSDGCREVIIEVRGDECVPRRPTRRDPTSAACIGETVDAGSPMNVLARA